MKRAQKLAMLSRIVEGTATPEQIVQLRRSREPIELTLNLGDENEPVAHNPNEPTFHINVSWGNGEPSTATAYYRHPDGHIEYVNG